MKQALFLILDEYADWEGAYLSSTLNQSEDWSVYTISLEDTVSSIGGFKTLSIISLVLNLRILIC